LNSLERILTIPPTSFPEFRPTMERLGAQFR
jgi:hypothetical protein